MKFLKDVVVVKLEPQEETAGGILIVDPIRHTNVQPAVVMQLGSKCKLPIEQGDIVYVSMYVGNEHEIDGLKVKVYDSEDILAVIESE